MPAKLEFLSEGTTAPTSLRHYRHKAKEDGLDQNFMLMPE
jgi:hypothetical protein